MRNGIFLMVTQFYFVVHAWKNQMATIVLTGANVVKVAIIVSNEPFASLLFGKNPFRERLFNQFLLLLRDYCRLLVDDFLFCAVDVDGLVNFRLLHVQRQFRQDESIHLFYAVSNFRFSRKMRVILRFDAPDSC